MKLKRCLRSAMTACVVGTLVAGPATYAQTLSSQATAEVARPEFSVGENWSYRRIDLWKDEEIERFREDIVAVLGSSVTVLWTIQMSKDVARAGSVTYEYLDGNTLAVFDPKMTGRHAPLQFPLFPGKTWQFSYDYKPGSGLIKVSQKAVVGGWEEVTVPAGKFRALKVAHYGQYQATDAGQSWSGNIIETYWYAPVAKRAVKMEYRDTGGSGSTWSQWRDELIELNLAKPIGGNK